MDIKLNRLKSAFGETGCFVDIAMNTDISTKIPIEEAVKPCGEVVLYHGTGTNESERILKEGIKPGEDNKIWFSATFEDAIHWAAKSDNKQVILRFLSPVNKLKENGCMVEMGGSDLRISCNNFKKSTPDSIMVYKLIHKRK